MWATCWTPEPEFFMAIVHCQEARISERRQSALSRPGPASRFLRAQLFLPVTGPPSPTRPPLTKVTPQKGGAGRRGPLREDSPIVTETIVSRAFTLLPGA